MLTEEETLKVKAGQMIMENDRIVEKSSKCLKSELFLSISEFNFLFFWGGGREEIEKFVKC